MNKSNYLDDLTIKTRPSHNLVYPVGVQEKVNIYKEAQMYLTHLISAQVETQLASNEAVCGQELLDTRPWARALGVGVEAHQVTPVTLTNSGETE